ncbi:hypothetical protein V8C26DRAFT_202171 [Trichoderma gracile]
MHRGVFDPYVSFVLSKRGQAFCFRFFPVFPYLSNLCVLVSSVFACLRFYLAASILCMSILVFLSISLHFICGWSDHVVLSPFRSAFLFCLGSEYPGFSKRRSAFGER